MKITFSYRYVVDNLEEIVKLYEKEETQTRTQKHFIESHQTFKKQNKLMPSLKSEVSMTFILS